MRPNGEAIEPEGIEPQVEVDVSPEDVQALTAHMAAHLAGLDEPFPAPAGAPSEEGEEGEETEEEFRDVQLERAVEELRGRLTGTEAAVAARGADAPVQEGI